MWSGAVCIIELLTGKRIFDGRTELEMVEKYLNFGCSFEGQFVEKCEFWKEFFCEKRFKMENQTKYFQKSISEFVLNNLIIFSRDEEILPLIDLLNKMLIIDPCARIKPHQAIMHPFFSQELENSL